MRCNGRNLVICSDGNRNNGTTQRKHAPGSTRLGYPRASDRADPTARE
eukprot:CAMPEP_0183563742 /NCGR_PEP_ID=MMETSP0371-20130417/103031_1 /TAXON_ID=268820 /ORGANISM="Peridinium aciculiferum, Strain PAER-2" /LENGTH=47 /DNA_ID= /DNA_START= /DNA_END= /DNA_ORIENTATION=